MTTINNITMAARKYLKDEDRKRPFKARGPYKNRGKKLGRKPGSWKVGPDPILHDKYIKWLKHKSQAAYRKEPHDLSWEDWQEIWPDDIWFQRGTAKESLCLTMIDGEIGWTKTNCEIVTRLEQLRRHGLNRTGCKHQGRGSINKRLKDL